MEEYSRASAWPRVSKPPAVDALGRTRLRRVDSFRAEANTWWALISQGHQPLWTEWAGTRYKVPVRCGSCGQTRHPTPGGILHQEGPGVCEPCGKRAAGARRGFRAQLEFRERLNRAGLTLLDDEWHGALRPYSVQCTDGHVTTQRPGDVQHRGATCAWCTGQSPQAAEENFRRALQAKGFQLLDDYVTRHHPHRAICPSGHMCYPRPSGIRRGESGCFQCARRVWDVVYVVQHEYDPRIKIGITSGQGGRRLTTHASQGYTRVHRNLQNLGAGRALEVERDIRKTIALAGIRPVEGREYYPLSALSVALDVVDHHPVVRGD